MTYGSANDKDGPPRWETRAAIDRLTVMLEPPYGDWMLDCWTVILAAPTRISEFCDLYEDGALNAEEKFALMQLIVESLDGLLNDRAAYASEAVRRVAHLLRRDYRLHLHTVEYWSLQGEADIIDAFAVTPLMREIRHECFRPEYERWVKDSRLQRKDDRLAATDVRRDTVRLFGGACARLETRLRGVP